MSEAASIINASFLPALGLAVVLAIGWRFVPPGRTRFTLQVVASLLFFVPQLAMLLLVNLSVSLLFYQDVVLITWVGLIAAASLGIPPFRRASVKAPKASWRRRGAVAIGCVFAVVALAWSVRLAQELLLPRTVVEGRVTDVGSRRGTRAPRSYRVAIEGAWYGATRDVWTAARHARTVRAEVGAGSGRILAFSAY